MGQALYRKYRSKSLQEIVGQEHITATLQNALKKDAISHAYLFTGPRGVGKTSIARILAHAVNDLPYTDESTHLDIIEIDAASNRRIDEIRELRERVHTAPASATYKVYIIDEVHMLTKEAFNALLKTLEEPPAHVIFILATTEAHKLPETIISRTQRFNFKPIEAGKAVPHMQKIAKAEGIDITPEALELISQHGGGSFRDSIGMLDQVGGNGTRVDIEDVQAMLGIAPDALIQDIIAAIADGQGGHLLELLAQLREQGYLASHTARRLAQSLRDSLVAGSPVLPAGEMTDILRQLIEVPASHDPESLLEIVLLTAVRPSDTSPAETADKPVQTAPPDIDKSDKTPAKKPKPTAEKSAEKPKESPPKSDALSSELWEQTLDALKQKYSTLYSIARMATPRYDGTTLILEFGFPFHQKRLNEAKNRQIITDILTDSLGRAVTVVCELNPDHKSPSLHKPEIKSALKKPVDTISNIFGGAEVLES